MRKVFVDTETVGYHGPTVLIQYAFDDEPIHLHCVWTEPIKDTISLIEDIVSSQVVLFNASFDWFHLCQTYTTLSRLVDWEEPPDIYQYAMAEPLARDGDCLKPAGCLDLMLIARKGMYQSTMDRKDIRIKRVPIKLAYHLAKELNDRIPLPNILFEKYADPTKRWTVLDVLDDMGDVISNFKDVVLKFNPSATLKALAKEALGHTVKKFDEISLPKSTRPYELGYVPFALPLADKTDNDGNPLSNPEDFNWKGTWVDVIRHHISFWAYNPIARKYAKNDVVYTRELYHFFKEPPFDDDDSVLACMVGAVRWKGFKIDIPKITKLRNDAIKIIENAKYNFRSVAVCKEYLKQVMSDVEFEICQGSTKGVVLEEISKWKVSEVCECGGMNEECKLCSDGLIETNKPHPAAIRAREILDARHLKIEIDLFNKLLLAGRFHADFKVIGTLSSRMSGASGLNAQGIKNSNTIRSCFLLAFNKEIVMGGDYDGFEVSIADAVYKDQKLHKQILTGKKIHALFGVKLFPPMTYEEIVASKNLDGEANKYARAKAGVFAMLYGGEAHTLINRTGVSPEVAEEAFTNWCNDYVQWGRARKNIFNKFCSMRQEGGIGTKVTWKDPVDYIESMFGFKRYFTLENKICKTLFQLAEDPPKEWLRIPFKVVRRDREQTTSGAVRSALFAASFGLQSANMRAAANHEIQSPGASITKGLQRKIWDLQPSGIGKWCIRPMNVHDEVMVVTIPEYKERLTDLVNGYNEVMKEKIPLIAMTWKDIKSWGEK